MRPSSRAEIRFANTCPARATPTFGRRVVLFAGILNAHAMSGLVLVTNHNDPRACWQNISWAAPGSGPPGIRPSGSKHTRVLGLSFRTDQARYARNPLDEGIFVARHAEDTRRPQVRHPSRFPSEKRLHQGVMVGCLPCPLHRAEKGLHDRQTGHDHEAARVLPSRPTPPHGPRTPERR